MNPRASQIVAAALCAFVATSGIVIAQGPTADPSPAPDTRPVPPTTGGTDSAPKLGAVKPEHSMTIYPGPIAITKVKRAAAWWNAAGANVQVTLTDDKDAADIVITPDRPLDEPAVGVTQRWRCSGLCRRVFLPQTEITLSPRKDYDREWTLVHEVGHALELEHHTNATGCSVMTPSVSPGRCGGHFPRSIPQADRAALTAKWGPAPRTAAVTPATASGHRKPVGALLAADF